MSLAARNYIRRPSTRVSWLPRQSKPSLVWYAGYLAGCLRGSNLAEMPLSTAPRKDLVILGYIEYSEGYPFTASSSTDAGGGAVDAVTGEAQNVNIIGDRGISGPFDTGTSANQVTAAHIGASCYAYDANTVYPHDNGGTLPRAGTVWNVLPDGKIEIYFDNLDKLSDLDRDTPPTGPTVRCVVTSLPANTVTAGVMTADVAGAWGTQDTTITLAQGDEVLIPEGLATLDNTHEAGPWVVSVLGASGVAAVLRRPTWWAHGAAMPLGARIAVAEGAKYGGSVWRSDAAKGSTIGTTAPALWPEKLTRGVTLASGTLAAAITDMPIKSLTTSTVQVVSQSTTPPHANTRVWRASALTAGVTGTASIQVVAETAPGTTNTSDVGTYVLLVTN